ncbi:DNA replication and repair protein RecF [Gammaproteobacteria bacterium]|nr:DNA replication and repair protein RecF [Gammaproteobacteria bacterium]
MIESLFIYNIRNLRQLRIYPSQTINLVQGKNASGKTSLLESIYLLSSLKSFRTNKAVSAISYNENKFTISAKVTTDNADIDIGVEKSDAGVSNLRIDGKTVKSVSKISQYLPTIVIDNQVFNLVDGTSIVRRKFINKGLFYHNMHFNVLWSSYSKILQHRNSLLKKRPIDSGLLVILDKQLEDLVIKIDALSRDYVRDIYPIFKDILNIFLDTSGLSFEYITGWQESCGGEKSFSKVLLENREQDIARGFTGVGAHRSDIKMLIDDNNVSNLLSRGQKKIFATSLHIAQAKFLQQLSIRKNVLLVDDLAAELDSINSDKLIDLLISLDSQLFITAIEPDTHSRILSKQNDKKVFTLEDGNIC